MRNACSRRCATISIALQMCVGDKWTRLAQRHRDDCTDRGRGRTCGPVLRAYVCRRAPSASQQDRHISDEPVTGVDRNWLDRITRVGGFTLNTERQLEQNQSG